jgi:serine protease Do
MKIKILSVLLFVFILTCTSLSAQSETANRVWPFPFIESYEVLSHWLRDNGFQVSRLPLKDASVKLIGLKENNYWQILLKPRSPLATEIFPEYTEDNQPDSEKIKELWTYMENYSRDLDNHHEESDRDLPSAVLLHQNYCVCIKADIDEGKNIRFTGFIIDKEGLIISTAHDLRHAKNLKVIINNGHVLEGYLIALDPIRDLALIKTNKQFNASIPISVCRDLLSMGEKIYSISCSSNQSSSIHYGFISGPPRRANGFPLWQVSMKVFLGDSGSPVFDKQGNLVGIVKGRYRGTDSIGFLIPSETIAEFLKEIRPQ